MIRATLLFPFLLQSILAVHIFENTTALKGSVTECRLNNFPITGFLDYVRCLGYYAEAYEVTTKDGYILTLFRVQKNKWWQSETPVLFWHGVFDSADSWVINNKNEALGLILIEKGYDVWFGNSRGNKYSLGHKDYNASLDVEYWDFSWQEMSDYDLPAAYTKIADATGRSDGLHYIGHSQGTTIMFAHLANPLLKPQASIVQTYTKTFCALGPVTYMKNVKTLLIREVARNDDFVSFIRQNFTLGIFSTPEWRTLNQMAKLFCKIYPDICRTAFELNADADTSTDWVALLPEVMKHFPAGASTKTFIHWRQEVNSGGRFQFYDYGPQKNLVKYKQITPPEMDPARIYTPVAMYVGTADLLADPQDATYWFSGLTHPEAVKIKEIQYYNIGHGTFLYGKRLPFLDSLIKFIAQR